MARDKESQVLLKDIEAGEIDVAAVHHVERGRLHRQVVERFDIGHFARGNVDETGDVAAQVDQGVQLDGPLAAAKTRPREQGQAEIDGRGIEGVDRLLQSDTQGVARVQGACAADEDAGEIGVDAPVAVLVGLGQGVARWFPGSLRDRAWA